MSGGGRRKIGKGGPIKNSIRRRTQAGTGRNIRDRLHHRAQTSVHIALGGRRVTLKEYKRHGPESVEPPKPPRNQYY